VQECCHRHVLLSRLVQPEKTGELTTVHQNIFGVVLGVAVFIVHSRYQRIQHRETLERTACLLPCEGRGIISHAPRLGVAQALVG
jgi:hypothetical protein